MALPFSLPIPPIISPNPAEQGTKADDALVPDRTEKVPLSKILSETGWGPKNGALQRIARPVVMAESGGIPDRVSYTGCCWGLFQMNVEVHTGNYGIPREKEAAIKWLKDPYNNASAARKLHRDQGWGPWEAYTNGAWRQHLGKDPLIETKGKRSITGAAGDVVDAATAPFDAVAKIVGALFSPDAYFRLGKGALGGVLLVVGASALVFIVASQASKSNAAKGVRKVAKAAATKKVT